MYRLVANETYPATINCRVDCLNDTGTYNPSLLLIKTKDASYKEITGMNFSRTHYATKFRRISSCNATNNVYYTEFEHNIYLYGARLDGAVVVCGFRHTPTEHPCWGQSYAVIHYSEGDPITTTMPLTPTTADPSTTTPPTTLTPTTTDQPTTTSHSTPPSTTTGPGLVTTSDTITAGTANLLAKSFTPTVSSLVATIIILAVVSVIIIAVLSCKLKQMKAKNKVFIAPILTDNAINNRALQDTYC